MKKHVLVGLFALALLGCMIVPAMATLAVSGGSVSPSVSLLSGTNVTVTQDVYIMDATTSTQIQLITDLTSPSWQKTLTVEGNTSTLATDSTQNLYVTYDPSAHSNFTTAIVHLTLTGIAPTVTDSVDKRMIQVQQLDSTSSVISSTINYLNATVRPNITTGNMSITSSPSGAKVYFNSTELQGSTPLNLTDLTPGTYTVTLKKSGYVTWGKKASVTAGNTITLDADLELQPTYTETATPTTAATTATATPTKKPTTKATTIPTTEVPVTVATTESPVSVWAGIAALGAIGILAVRKK
ncbi:MAG: PEGA domain-containing protein [Methanoregulaceae archaeon]